MTNLDANSLANKLVAITKDPLTYKTTGTSLQIFMNGQMIKEIPIGTNVVQSSQSSTWR
jgi:hypothetical protein